jgi:hypothetical protein
LPGSIGSGEGWLAHLSWWQCLDPRLGGKFQVGVFLTFLATNGDLRNAAKPPETFNRYGISALGAQKVETIGLGLALDL